MIHFVATTDRVLPILEAEELNLESLQFHFVDWLQIRYHHLKELKEELKEKDKCAELVKKDIREPQQYLLNSSLAEARVAFRVQCGMLDIPRDMHGRYVGRMGCMACLPWRQESGKEVEEAPTETREHIMECPGYAFLRAGKDLDVERDRTHYFMDVLRMKKCSKK